MARIPVNLSDVEAYENLPLGSYLGDISKMELKPTEKEGKFDQIMVSYLVVDGELTGRVSSEWLSMSPKAAFRLKKWFGKFGLEDLDEIEFDDDTNLMTEPDLTETRVIFKVYEDKPKPGDTEPSVRTALVSVEDDEIPAPKPKASTKKKAAEPEDDDEEEETVDPKEAKRAALAAQLAALDEDDDEEEEPAPVKPRKVAKTVAAPAKKRQLR